MKTRNNNTGQRSKGFTLAEMLIVVAIVGVVSAVAIPVFARQQEKSREATDLANVRSAYTQVVVAVMEDNTDSPLYDNSDPTRPIYKMEVSLVQKKDGWQTTNQAKLTVAGITPQDGTSRWLGSPAPSGGSPVCWVIYDVKADTAYLNWQGHEGDAGYMSAVAPYQFETLMYLKTETPNSDRVAADRQTITSLGNAILAKGWTLPQLKQYLGIKVEGNTVRVADFYQLKDGSYNEGETYTSAGFVLTVQPDFEDILSDMGFIGGNTVYLPDSADTPAAPYDGKTSEWVQYENSLFFSDELASNKFGNYASDEHYAIGKTKRSIIIQNVVTDPDTKVITGFTIYSKAMDDQANISQNDRKPFSVTISSETP